MFVPFESISPSSRIWIYQSDRKFSNEQKTTISHILSQFTEQWAAHGHSLKTSFDIRFDQFIILAADESHVAASGCSIDSSVRVIKDIEAATGLNFFNRNLVAFRKGDKVELVALGELKQKFQGGIWNEATSTFNNLVNTKAQLEQGWIVPAGSTWLKRYLPAETVTT